MLEVINSWKALPIMASRGINRSSRDTSSMLGRRGSPVHPTSSASGAERACEGLAGTAGSPGGVALSSRDLGTLRLADDIAQFADASPTSGLPLTGALAGCRNEESDSVEIIYNQVNETNTSIDIIFINKGSDCEQESAYGPSDDGFCILEGSYRVSGDSSDSPESSYCIVHEPGCYTSEEYSSLTSSDGSYLAAPYHPEERPAGRSRMGHSARLTGYYANERQEREDAAGRRASLVDTGNIVAVVNDAPEGQQPNDSDIHIVSSIIRTDPDHGSLPPSFFGNDVNDYDRVRGIELMPRECSLRRMHTATARFWSSMIHSETFPSLEDFRTLSRRLLAEERAAEWDSFYSFPSESDASDAADDMFPGQQPAISQYMGPVRYDLIEYECIDVLMERIQWVMSFGTRREAVGLIKLLTDLASFFSRSEIEYIAEVVHEEFRMEGFTDAGVASIITFAYDWSCQSSAWRLYSKKKYNVVAYSQLLDVRDTACHICYDGFKSRSRVAVMDCLHIFHSRCLNLWLRESPRCPLCRALPVMPNRTE